MEVYTVSVPVVQRLMIELLVRANNEEEAKWKAIRVADTDMRVALLCTVTDGAMLWDRHRLDSAHDPNRPVHVVVREW
jgi:hypothetical protein